VRIFGKELKDLTEAERSVLGAAPQNPQTLFVKKTVYDDLMEILSGRGLGKEERARRAMAAAKLCRIETALDSHPYDLSGGEQQRAALAKVLVLRPKILLLDEPTKGLDAEFKRVFAGILNNLNRRGVTVVTVSHDVEFCAEYAKRCAFVFDGATLCVGEPREFFVGNSFYTTAACRMARGILPGATTTADIIAALGGAADERIAAEGPEDFWEDAEPPALPAKQEERAALPIWRKAAAVLIALLFAATVAYIFRNSEKFAAFISGGEGAAAISGPGALEGSVALIALCAEILSFSALLFFDGEKAKAFQYQTPEDKRKFSRRTRAAAPFILLAAPLTIYLGTYYFGDRKYYFISSLLILETMAPFVATFEGRKPQARELVVISALCAIGVAGRAAFFMLPHFKPVAALAILAGVAFGGETGFLVGAVTAFASNMFFGQGPWTMWQMFAYGAVGFLAGALFSKGLLRRARAALCAYGGLATFIIYGGVMNTAAVLMFQDKPTFAMFISAIVQGIPLDLTHAAATVMFLWALARPMLEKLDRIKMKYGLME
jgi:energy-coupling factor transport system ATP-binding protein